MKLSSLDLGGAEQESLEVVKDELPEGATIEEPWHGLKTWVNPINGFRVIRIHYSVDPKRRTPEWKASERRKYGESEWNREQEIIWQSFKGRAVYADWWQHEIHVAKQSLKWNPKLPVCRGWDFGLNGACLFTQLFPHMRLFVLREAVSEDIGFERLLEEVQRLSNEWFPGAEFIEFVDPTGRYRQGADEKSYVSMLTNPPIRARQVVSGANDMPSRIKGVTDFLKEHVKGLQCYQVDPSCETLIKGFDGGYFYPFGKGNQLKPKPDKNFYSHVSDANQYVCSKIRHVKLGIKSRSGVISEPRYTDRAPTDVDRLVSME